MLSRQTEMTAKEKVLEQQDIQNGQGLEGSPFCAPGDFGKDVSQPPRWYSGAKPQPSYAFTENILCLLPWTELQVGKSGRRWGA